MMGLLRVDLSMNRWDSGGMGWSFANVISRRGGASWLASSFYAD